MKKFLNTYCIVGLVGLVTVASALALGISLAVPVFLVVMSVYYTRLFRAPNRPPRLLYCLFLFMLALSGSYLVFFQQGPIYFLPFAAAAMLCVILFNDLAATFVLTLAVAVSVSGLYRGNFHIELTFLTSGMIAALLVRGARRRNTIIRAGAIVGLVQALLLFLQQGITGASPRDYLFIALNGVVYSFLVIGILPVFEYLFKTVTNISLLELADFNHPLLNRLMLEAPGTYHHSLIVGNLSEAACSAVGAHALLARIGAYYHDIGKLEKAEYFSENQSCLENSKHDDLSPTMSKMVIMNHIKQGVELAKQHKLNSRIVEFIQQHHGTSLVYYFYMRALENTEDENAVRQEGFRYSGPKPATREAAIIMLADSVEAATRSLKSPTPENIRELVHKLINNKFIDGQLDECDLTLRDLEKIAQVFVRILTGIYHSRISYPDAQK